MKNYYITTLSVCIVLAATHVFQSTRITSIPENDEILQAKEKFRLESDVQVLDMHSVASIDQNRKRHSDKKVSIETASKLNVPIEYLLQIDDKSFQSPKLQQQNPAPSDLNEIFPAYNAAEYEKMLDATLKAFPDEKTACHSNTFYSGLNNQIHKYLGVCFAASSGNFSQIIEESITWKDTLGTNDYLPHQKLWDVVHWNSFFPTLPRFARYDIELHPDLDLIEINSATINGTAYATPQTTYNVTWDIWENRNKTRPQPIIRNLHEGFNKYRRLSRVINNGRVHLLEEMKHHLVMYEEILKGALRPHPFLQGIVDREIVKLRTGGKFMTLHARVEPDMARQDRVCSTLKVWNVTQIFDAIYDKYPEPPVNTVLIQFNRALMENEAKRSKNMPDDKFYQLNDYNLKEINKKVQGGMWGGKVKVVEAGSGIVEEAGDPYYKFYSNIAGGIVNLFIAIQSDIFIGTEVSTYSVQAMNTRFYREERENYVYRPEGLHWLTPPGVNKPHRFVC